VTAQVSSGLWTDISYPTAVVSSAKIVTVTTDTYTTTGTSTGLIAVSGYYAILQAPAVAIGWQSTDAVVLDWLKTQNLTDVPAPNNSTTPPSPRPTHKPGISGGAIAGIAIGALVSLGLVIGGLFFCLRRRRSKAKPVEEPHPAMTVMEHAVGKWREVSLYQTTSANNSCRL
jgi:hypothetical protein